VGANEGAKTVKIKGYEITPVRMIVPAMPAVPDGPLDIDRVRTVQEIPFNGVRTEATTVRAAERKAEEMLADCRRRVEHHQYHALIELLDANPGFIANAWVRETYLELARKKLLVRRRGRIQGKHQFHPLIVAALVEHLIATGQAETREKAFVRLEELKLLSGETAKDLYYRGRRQDRFQPILLEFPEFRRQVSVEEGRALLRKAHVLQAGETVIYIGEDPALGETELAISGR